MIAHSPPAMLALGCTACADVIYNSGGGEGVVAGCVAVAAEQAGVDFVHCYEAVGAIFRVADTHFGVGVVAVGKDGEGFWCVGRTERCEGWKAVFTFVGMCSTL